MESLGSKPGDLSFSRLKNRLIGCYCDAMISERSKWQRIGLKTPSLRLPLTAAFRTNSQHFLTEIELLHIGIGSDVMRDEANKKMQKLSPHISFPSSGTAASAKKENRSKPKAIKVSLMYT